jgi:hypothetical protein
LPGLARFNPRFHGHNHRDHRWLRPGQIAPCPRPDVRLGWDPAAQGDLPELLRKKNNMPPLQWHFFGGKMIINHQMCGFFPRFVDKTHVNHSETSNLMASNELWDRELFRQLVGR